MQNLKNRKEDLEKKATSIVGPKWNDFIKFRKNHYNSKIEKLLIDIGLKDEILTLGLEYPKININNKEKDGTIEDYIAYFDEILM